MKKNIKSVIVSSIVLAIVACTNSVPNNTRPAIQENFPDLDKEYNFATKELTETYLKRKLNKWLYESLDGEKLVREIAFARYKHSELFCTIVREDLEMADAIKVVPEVSQRSSFDIPFRNFINECIPDPVAETGEFRVNRITYAAQGEQVAAMDSEGDFVIAWQSREQGVNGYEIFARLYNSAAVSVKNQIRVSSNTTFSQTFPAVAMNSSGNFVITWVDGEFNGNGRDGSGYGVFARRYDSSGLPAGSEFQVNSYTTGNQFRPSVAIDDAGDFVITWQSRDPGVSKYDVFAQKFSADGSVNGSEFQVNTFTMDSQQDPKVAMDDSDGDFIITWQSYYQIGNFAEIYLQRYNSSGDKQGSEVLVNTVTDYNQNKPSIAMDSDGDFVVVWHSFDHDGHYWGIYGQRYNNNNTKEGSEFLVNTFTSGSQTDPTVAMDDDGDFVVTWNSYGQLGIYGSDAFGQRYNSAGEAQGSEFQINIYTTEKQSRPSVAMDSTGDFVVTWKSQDQDGDGYGVYARRYDSSGNTL